MGHALRTWNPAEAVGLAVDPVWHLLKRLPDVDGVQKVQAAIVATDGWQKLHYVQEDALQRFPRAYSAWLARGTATLGDPHPQLLEWLKYDGIDLSEIMTWEWVPVWSVATLATRYRIFSIDVSKWTAKAMTARC